MVRASSTPADPRRTRLSAADRRASIIDAATVVFAESGFQRSTMAQIAARLGVTEPVLFQNFGSKTGLYAAVVAHASGQMSAMMRAFAAETDSIAGLLAHLLSPGHIDELHAPGSLGVIFADAMTLTAEPAVEQAVRQQVSELADVLAEVVIQGQRAGELRSDLDPAAAAWLVLSFLAAHRFRSAVMPDRQRLEDRIGAMTLRTLVEPRHQRPGAGDG
ncbi:TetR/AcrR family transcriptional regulator [Nocardia sp. NBC_01009]|uniref:TetR/AcrR family transcriptional regulator n=1 Tax=Nocardia sp. NBC_01009 TaxID=2975996 RepID=UPI00386F5A40|nr:TetR/AcrR family transcriptional regulator [Nocardia sp. NBC_01009]